MRYERKYKVETLSAAAVRQTVKLLPQGFRIAFPERVINNIYFDTPDFIKIRENRDGISERKKLRVRWYGDIRDGEKATLEIKGKQNQLGTKAHFKTSFSDFSNLKALTNFVLGASGEKIYGLQPVIMNQYRRTYYASTDGKFRITVDEQLRFFPLFDRGGNTSINSVLNADQHFWIETPVIILELKYGRDEEAAASDLAQYLPFQLTKYSKFAMGMQHVVNKVV